MIKTPELGRAAIALFLAGALWLLVSAEEPAAQWVPVRIMLTLDTAVVLADTPTPVRAFVVGRRRDLLKLASSPITLQRAITDDARDSVRIELREQDLDIAPGADVSVRDVRPRLITVRLRRVMSEVPPVETPMPSARAEGVAKTDAKSAVRSDSERPPIPRQ